MLLTIPKDLFDNPVQPQIFLCNADKSIIGELQVYDAKVDAKWNAYSELTFSINRKYTDLIVGEQHLHPLFDKVEGLRKIYVKDIGYFVVQDSESLYSDQESKTLKCFSSEYETGQRYLESFHINTGQTTSAEVIYAEQQHGTEYNKDELYQKVTNYNAGNYDPYQNYYIKSISANTQTVTYEQIQIADAVEFGKYNGDTESGTLYVKKYDNVRFYWNSNGREGLSLLHLIFKKIPNWSIGYVDPTLWKQERKFEENRVAVYDFLMNQMSEAFDCIVEWDTIANVVNFYAATEDGITTENSVDTLFDTDIYISRDNLANEINVSYSTDDIKTQLRVSGDSDDIDIRDVNLGQNYILNLDYYAPQIEYVLNTDDYNSDTVYYVKNSHNEYTPYEVANQTEFNNAPTLYVSCVAEHSDWFGEDLGEAWRLYTDKLSLYTDKYQTILRQWTEAYTTYDNLMNAVPADFDVLLVGDVFTKLYCICTPIDNKIDNAVKTLTKNYLNLYFTKETNGVEKNDNVLLTLKDVNQNTAVIRVSYIDGDYSVKITTKSSSTGASATETRSLTQWVNGEITDKNLDLNDYKIASIGTLGAYLCLAKDESKPENLEEYGVRLLQEKRDVYMQIFNVQTEGLFSAENYECIASATIPTGSIEKGDFWLDTSGSELALKQYNGSKWVTVDVENDLKNCQNYARFIANYEKLQAVQEVLTKKEKEASYLLNGVVQDKYYFTTKTVSQGNLQNVAKDYFANTTITNVSYDADIPLYIFKTSKDDTNTYAIYLQAGVPYISYNISVGVNQAEMNYIKSKTDIESCFTDAQMTRLSPFIREDEYSNTNIAFNGYESDAEKLELRKSLLEEAQKELAKICQPKLSFNMTMANILVMPAFLPLLSRFRLGNYVRVELRPGYIQRARLLGVSFSLSDLSDFSAEFGNLITTRSEIDKISELLQQSVQAGKTVASNSSSWQKAVDKSTALDKAIQEGLQDAALSVGASNGQSISWDQYGFRCKKLIEGTTDQYDPKQLAIINNKIVFTQDNWATSSAALGEFTVPRGAHQGQTLYGLLAQAVVSGYIEGSEIYGGMINIGDNFIVDQNGNVTIKAGNIQEYVKEADVKSAISDAIQNHTVYSTEIQSVGSTVFTDKEQTATLECRVYSWDEDITDAIDPSYFQWYKVEDNQDILFASNVKTIKITYDDMKNNAVFHCVVTLNENGE